MLKDIRIWIFIILSFLLGSINVLYNVTFYIVLLSALCVNIAIDPKSFFKEVRKEWKYLMLPIVVCIYLVVHYLFSLLGESVGYKISWRTTEPLLLYFFVITLYLLSLKKIMTPSALWKALKSFCWGVLVLNFTKFFCVTGLSVFSEPTEAIAFLYTSRFGCNMDMLGGYVYLEPQTTYLVISALISYFAILKYDNAVSKRRELLGSIVIFVFSLIFLSFAVAKGAILSLCVGMLILSVLYWSKKTLRFKLLSLCLGLLLFVGGYVLCSDVYVDRYREMKQEIIGVQEGNYVGGTVASRLGALKESFSHWSEYKYWGLGVYKNARADEWYATSPYLSIETHNSHNTFAEYWLDAGLLGLVFILCYFVCPIIRMIRHRCYLYLAIAIISSLFISGNIFILTMEDSRPMFIFMLVICYLFQDNLLKIQKNEYY